MKSPFYFIVKPVKNKRYSNTIEVGERELVVSTSQEDHMFSNRFAEVVATPVKYDGEIQKGDALLVHHNVFKLYYDMKGREKSGKSFFKDNLFLLDEEQFFLYKHNNQWKSHSKYCFVKPLEEEEYYISKFTKEEPLKGTIKYSNEELLNLGVKEGDTVCFEPNSEYEFTVDGEKLYRMFTNNIAVVL